MTEIIGLTGGIGSGKTTIGEYFRTLGVPVYIADEEARKISELPEVAEAIKSLFGQTIFANGKLDREALAKIVFNDPLKLKQLNSIIHPAVRAHFADWLQRHSEFPLVIKETAILFESGSDVDCDYIITVTAPTEIRINRVMLRDKVSRESVMKRIENQWTEADRISKSDFVIENTDLQQAKKQAIEILKKLSIQ
ncbi:MAG TPA: dephospho-CoA kinase [Flavobacterium sp.]|nr:dephospho-CoA kinase [Flavobacterium sp.]